MSDGFACSIPVSSHIFRSWGVKGSNGDSKLLFTYFLLQAAAFHEALCLVFVLIQLPTFLPNVWIKNFQQGHKLKSFMLASSDSGLFLILCDSLKSPLSTKVLVLIFNPMFYPRIKYFLLNNHIVIIKHCSMYEMTHTHRQHTHNVTPKPQLGLPSIFTASVRCHNSCFESWTEKSFESAFFLLFFFSFSSSFWVLLTHTDRCKVC